MAKIQSLFYRTNGVYHCELETVFSGQLYGIREQNSVISEMKLDWTAGDSDQRVNSGEVDILLPIVYFVECYALMEKKNIINSITTLHYVVIVSTEKRQLRLQFCAVEDSCLFYFSNTSKETNNQSKDRYKILNNFRSMRPAFRS